MATKKSSALRRGHRTASTRNPAAGKRAGKKASVRKLRTSAKKTPAKKSKPAARRGKGAKAAAPSALVKLVAKARVLGKKIAKAV